jgi:26S proteasome regulatory subunit N13
MAGRSIRFRAGRVLYDEQTKIATPEQIQGVITIQPSPEEESFYSFEWTPKDKVVSVEKEELLVIPGDVTWKQITQAKTGRIFELKFLSSGARHLFWLQEVNDNEDDLSELSKKDQELLERIDKIFEPAEEEQEEEEEEGEEEHEKTA